MSIAKRIRTARRTLRITQHQLAVLCGVTYRTVQHWEAGARHVPVHKLRIVSKTLGLSLDDLVP